MNATGNTGFSLYFCLPYLKQYMSFQDNYVAILAGGIGSRFWPESRQKNPKQFLDILGTGKSMLQNTFDRFAYIFPKENIFVVTHESYFEKVKSNLPGLNPQNIICEPSRKNTAASAAYVAYKLYHINPNANILISPVDHLILDERAFERQVYEALDFTAKHDAILALGIKPTRPETGYNYIQYQPGDCQAPFYKVKTFTEKPGIDLARTFLKSGDFLWNSGIFIWRAKTYIQAFEKYLPELSDVFQQAENILNTTDERKAMEILYAQLTNASLDHGILERAQNIYVVRSFFGWKDLGNWSSAYEQTEKDYLGNASGSESNVMIIDASNCMIKTPKNKLVVLQGLDEFIVVDTADVLLVCERSKEQQIKGYIAEIRRNKGEKYL